MPQSKPKLQQAKLILQPVKPKLPLQKLPKLKKLPKPPWFKPTTMTETSTDSKKEILSTTLMKMARLPAEKQPKKMSITTNLKVWA